VGSLREAYQAETGRTLGVTGIRAVADASVFAAAGIPCLYHGLAGEGIHGDLEWIPECELARGARVYLRTVANYLGIAG
jgi:acetylornithine deacetylase/succinyl-diaminopimelate desuccinylase-like protein